MKRQLLLVMLVLVSASASAMVYDNRFFPLFSYPKIGPHDTCSGIAPSIMVATSSGSYGDKQDNERLGLPEMYGKFDLIELAGAMQCLGKPLPAAFNSAWLDEHGGEMRWRVDGRIQARGVAFAVHQALTCHLSVGGSVFFMRVDSSQTFRLEKTNVITSENSLAEFERARCAILSDLGLDAGHWRRTDIGDVDLYVRAGYQRPFTCKFRDIDVGLTLGLLVPVGARRDECATPSVPFGGNGHWGVYAAVDGLFEVKEDIKVGILARVNKRFARTCPRRVPVKGEPSIFGAAAVNTKVTPGVTAIFSPYIFFEHLRDGLGLGLQYTLVSHQSDEWCEVGKAPNNTPLNTSAAEETSKWGVDYVSVNAFYDFGKHGSVVPFVFLRWDVPTKLLVVNRSAATHRVCLGIEFAF